MQDERSLKPETALIAEARAVAQGVHALLPQLLAARKNWFRSRNEAYAQALNALQAQADVLVARHQFLLDELQRITGIPEEVFQQFEKAQILGDVDSPPLRSDLTADKVATTDSTSMAKPSIRALLKS